MGAIASTVPYVPNLLNLRKELFVVDQRTLLKYLDFLEKAEVIYTLSQKTKGNKILQKPGKIYLGNTNYYYSLNMKGEEIGTIRETFFESQISVEHELRLPLKGDFLVDENYFFEIGGTSILIPSIVMRLKKEYDIDITIIDIFKYPSIKALKDNIFGYNPDSSFQDKSKINISKQKENRNKHKLRLQKARGKLNSE